MLEAVATLSVVANQAQLLIYWSLCGQRGLYFLHQKGCQGEAFPGSRVSQ